MISRGKVENSSSVTRPKNWPAPFRAHRRSGVPASTIWSSPEAVMRRAEMILSDVVPHNLVSAQIPPPRA